LQSACRVAAREANLGKPVTDENNNNRLDTDFIGYPTEGYALSNGICAVISRPRFIDAAFSVDAQDARVTLRIKY
jgi:uncharacterized protein (DUF2141 family)